MKRKYCYFWLTCNEEEKEKIARVLLDKHLISCAKFTSVSSMYWWNGEIEKENETLIIMESAEDLFTEIEAEVTKIHSYDTFVLQMISVAKINDKAANWMDANLKEQS